MTNIIFFNPRAMASLVILNLIYGAWLVTIRTRYKNKYLMYFNIGIVVSLILFYWNPLDFDHNCNPAQFKIGITVLTIICMISSGLIYKAMSKSEHFS